MMELMAKVMRGETIEGEIIATMTQEELAALSKLMSTSNT